MKTPFTIVDGPVFGMGGPMPLEIDSSLVGLDPVAGDRRFILRWDRTRSTGQGVAAGLYRFVRDEKGAVTAVHVAGPDDRLLKTPEELQAERGAAAVAKVRELAVEHPEVAALLKEGT